MKFIDEVQISVESGKGGQGCVSFRREKHVPRGGPDGGSGGRGGHIILRTSSRVNTLLELRYKRHYKARGGHQGEPQNRTGADGEDLVIEVPVGTVVTSLKSDKKIDLIEDNQEFIYLKGGRGGQGNMFFKNSVNQAPTRAQPGEEGEFDELKLELKLLADVGLLGFPNAGKSTLISKLSAARPKVADYPFTTLTPNLGVVKVSDDFNFVIADIPGIIPGAHQGVGLGLQFLKHIERTKVFLHLVDISPMTEGDPIENFQAINNELLQYDKAQKTEFPLAERQQLVALNKCDLMSVEEIEIIKRKFEDKGYAVFPISAVTGLGLDALLYELKSIMEKV